jgi:hypothetical protein
VADREMGAALLVLAACRGSEGLRAADTVDEEYGEESRRLFSLSDRLVSLLGGLSVLLDIGLRDLR